jgi:hypothetical protein
MNIILLTKERGWQRQLDLRRPATAVLTACALTLILASIFAAGFAFATLRADPMAARVGETLSAQRADLAEIKRSLHEQLDALAVRVGPGAGARHPAQRPRRASHADGRPR